REKITGTNTPKTRPLDSILASMLLEHARKKNPETRLLILTTLFPSNLTADLSEEQEVVLQREVDRIASIKNIGDMVAETRSSLTVIELYGPSILDSDPSNEMHSETVGRMPLEGLDLPDNVCDALNSHGIFDIKQLCH